MAASDAKPVPLKNTAFRVSFDIENVTNGALITTWADMDSEVSLDGGAFADCTNEATEIGTTGIGYLDLTADEMNADTVIVKVTVSNANARVVRLYFNPVESTDIPVNSTAISGSTVVADRLELQYDGTGLTGNTYPATQAELTATTSTVTDIFNAVDARLPGTLSGGRMRADMEAISTDTTAANNLELQFDGTGLTGNTFPSTQLQVAGISGGASVQNIFEADPADYDADADSFAARVLAILAKANQITGPFAYKGPVSATGRVTIYQGKDYNADDGTALEWTSDSALTGLDAGGASVSFDINGDQYAGVVSGSVGAWTIRVNLTAAQTAALPVGDSPYELTAVLASGRTPPPLAVGTVTVKQEV